MLFVFLINKTFHDEVVNVECYHQVSARSILSYFDAPLRLLLFGVELSSIDMSSFTPTPMTWQECIDLEHGKLSGIGMSKFHPTLMT